MFTTLLNCCDKLCPIKVFRIRGDKPPWYTDDLYELAKSRDELFLNGRKEKDQLLLQEAPYLRNVIKRDTIRFKQDYYLDVMNRFKDDPKKLGSI